MEKNPYLQIKKLVCHPILGSFLEFCQGTKFLYFII